MRRFLALGDSYTIGEGVGERERWPWQLVQALRAGGLSVADPEIIATTGWTTDELAQAIGRANPRPAFDLVTLLVGVNDHYRGRDARGYADAFGKVFNLAVRLGRGDSRRVVVVSIPDWGVTPFAAADPRGTATIAAEIDQFNSIGRREAATAGASFVDITPASRAAAGDTRLLASDGLHPSGAMYGCWAALIAPAARAALTIAD